MRYRQPAQQPQGQRRRLGHALFPERVAGRRQGVQLATGAEGPIPSDAAHVLAQGDQSINPGRNVDATAGDEGELSRPLRPRC